MPEFEGDHDVKVEPLHPMMSEYHKDKELTWNFGEFAKVEPHEAEQLLSEFMANDLPGLKDRDRKRLADELQMKADGRIGTWYTPRPLRFQEDL